jgi:hypothetical protein
MTRTAAAGFCPKLRAPARSPRRVLGQARLAAALILLGLVLSTPCHADAVKGEATLSTETGFARLLFRFAEDVTTEVTAAGSIIVIRFERPVDVAVERLSDAVPDYVSSVRRDPDGTAIRMSLARRVTINTMSAGERTFIDLLPDS